MPEQPAPVPVQPRTDEAAAEADLGSLVDLGMADPPPEPSPEPPPPPAQTFDAPAE